VLGCLLVLVLVLDPGRSHAEDAEKRGIEDEDENKDEDEKNTDTGSAPRPLPQSG
jgi:hypothetical protein